MDMELANYRMCSASRVIVQSSEMVFVILMSEYGTDISPHAFLKVFSYSAYAYQYAAIPYYGEMGNGLANSALHFIGKGIEDYYSTREFCKWSGLLEVFGKNWPGVLMDCPTRGFLQGIEDGDRATFMQNLLGVFNKEFAKEIALYSDQLNPPPTSFFLDTAGRVGARKLSRELYGDERIPLEFFKNNFAFVQDAIENFYAYEAKKFG